MWQIFALAWLLTNALENAVDKLAVLRAYGLHSVVQTFYRVTVYVVIIAAVGMTGAVDDFAPLYDWRIPVLGFFGALVSLSYTYALAKIEVTSIATISYVSPVFFLLVDIFWVGANISPTQIAGISLLVLGGIGISLDGSSRKVKEGITPAILGIFLYWTAFHGTERYLFKAMNAEAWVGATAFYGNSWAWAAVFLLLAVLWARKAGQLVTPSARKFLGNSVASKSCDVGTTIFEAKALTLATVSQVSAMQALNPLVLLVVTATVQIVFKVHLAEKLDRANLAWKASMAALLVTGGFMVR